MTKKPAYAPRNALNADALKAGIAARSQARQDTPEISAWLLNHFYRHLVANFEPARRIETLDEARAALSPASLPKWVAARLPGSRKIAGERAATPQVPIVWIDPAAPPLLMLEQRLLEFLNARKGTALEGKLERINCPQALALWEKEHAEIALRIERGWRQSQPEALRPVCATPNGAFVEFLPDSPLLRAEMAFETYIMRHCLGQFADRRALTGGYGESYAEAIEQKQLRLLSFRDVAGQPHITIGAAVREDGKVTVEQVKGKQNRPPIERYIEDVLICLNALETDEETPDDCIAIGIVRTPKGWQRMEQVTHAATQTRLVARHPQLFYRLSAPTPMVEWLIAALQPGLFSERKPQAASVRYAIREMRESRETAPGQSATGKPLVVEEIPWPGMEAGEAEAILPVRLKARGFF
ncbi:MAG: hypothetical protein LBQ75_00755 [Zoogloeaceae bacterium]|nr:hypothetical protein [Zoogloeaceae bacterium]